MTVVDFHSPSEDNRQRWRTPRRLFDALNARYRFDVDAAADDTNALLPLYWTSREDGVAQLNDKANDALRAFINPPGANIYPWVEAARNRWVRGAFTALLLPARTDAMWFHSHALVGQVFFVQGRIEFGAPAGVQVANGNNAASVFVVFDPDVEMQIHGAIDSDTGEAL